MSTLPSAKTIDLCNNPLTKTPKLEVAKQLLPEWVGLDNRAKEMENTFKEQEEEKERKEREKNKRNNTTTHKHAQTQSADSTACAQVRARFACCKLI